MYARHITPVIQQLAAVYPVVSITGPRQSGKTTLARHLFPQHPYISFETIDVRHEFQSDPRAFLKKYEDGAVFDEVQYVPDVVSYLQQIVDEDERPGRYILTGSQNFAVSNTVAQSLAGRVAVITLLPLSAAELGEHVSWVDQVFAGGYPRLHVKKLASHQFFPFYIQTYLERDARQLKQIGDLTVFRNFLQICAAHVGQVVNYTSLAQDAGISVTAARQWLSVLEASYIIFTLPPYYKNLNKRRVKMPKLYFYDTGLACSLLGFETTSQLERYYRSGALFENFVALEIYKHRYNKGLLPQLSFWRDYSGLEVDLIAEWGGTTHALELKSSAVLNSRMLAPLKKFCELEPHATPYIVYAGSTTTYAGIDAFSYDAVATQLDERAR